MEEINDSVLLDVQLNTDDANASIDSLVSKVTDLDKKRFGDKSVRDLKDELLKAEASVKRLAELSGELSPEYIETQKELSKMKDTFIQLVNSANDLNADKKVE